MLRTEPTAGELQQLLLDAGMTAALAHEVAVRSDDDQRTRIARRLGWQARCDWSDMFDADNGGVRCPYCGNHDSIILVEPTADGYRRVGAYHDGMLSIVYTGEQFDGEGGDYFLCSACVETWEWPDDMPEISWD